MDRINKDNGHPSAEFVDAKFQLTDAIVSSVFTKECRDKCILRKIIHAVSVIAVSDADKLPLPDKREPCGSPFALPPEHATVIAPCVSNVNSRVLIFTKK